MRHGSDDRIDFGIAFEFAGFRVVHFATVRVNHLRNEGSWKNKIAEIQKITEFHNSPPPIPSLIFPWPFTDKYQMNALTSPTNAFELFAFFASVSNSVI